MQGRMKVLFATDGSIPSGDALVILERLAHPYSIDITVLSVVPVDPSEGMVRIYRGRRRAKKNIAAAIGDLINHGFRAGGIMRFGAAASEIIKVVDDYDFELVVMGHRSQAEIAHQLLGSVSTEVLRDAPCSVLIARGARYGRGRASVLMVLRCTASDDEEIAFASRLLDPRFCDIYLLGVAETGQDLGEAREYMEEAAKNLAKKGFDAEADVVQGPLIPSISEAAHRRLADVVLVSGKRAAAPLIEEHPDLLLDGPGARPVGATLAVDGPC